MPWQKGSNIRCCLLKKGWALVQGRGHILPSQRLWCCCARPHKPSLPSGGILVPLASSSSRHISAPKTDLHRDPPCPVFKDARHSDSECEPNFFKRKTDIKRKEEWNYRFFFHRWLPLNCLKIKGIKFPDLLPMSTTCFLPENSASRGYWEKKERKKVPKRRLFTLGLSLEKGALSRWLWAGSEVDGDGRCCWGGSAITPSRFSPELATRATQHPIALSSIMNLEKLSVLEFIINA